MRAHAAKIHIYYSRRTRALAMGKRDVFCETAHIGQFAAKHAKTENIFEITLDNTHEISYNISCCCIYASVLESADRHV